MTSKAIFLDRDGVINRYPGYRKYVTSLKGFRFLPGAKQALKKLHRNGFRVFIISNQAGVGKGVFSRRTLNAITAKMLKEIERHGGKVEAVYYCLHRPEANCRCRKPKAGFLYKIRRERSVDIGSCFFVGDTIRDVQTARAAGLKSILLLSGKEKFSNRKQWQPQPDFFFKDLKEAVDFIISKQSASLQLYAKNKAS